MVTEVAVDSGQYSWLTFLMCFCWGYVDGSQNIFLFQNLSFQFAGKSDPFAVFTIVMGISVFSFDNLEGLIDHSDTDQVLIYTGCIGIFGLAANALLFSFDFKEPKDELESLIEPENYNHINRSELAKSLKGFK